METLRALPSSVKLTVAIGSIPLMEVVVHATRGPPIMHWASWEVSTKNMAAVRAAVKKTDNRA